MLPSTVLYVVLYTVSCLVEIKLNNFEYKLLPF